MLYLDKRKKFNKAQNSIPDEEIQRLKRIARTGTYDATNLLYELLVLQYPSSSLPPKVTTAVVNLRRALDRELDKRYEPQEVK